MQRSGYPSAYAVYEKDARALASALTGYSPAAFWCHLPKPGGSPRHRRPPRGRELRDVARAGVRQVDGARRQRAALEVPTSSTARGWAVASYLVAHARSSGSRGSPTGTAGGPRTSNRGWQHASDSASADSVVIG